MRVISRFWIGELNMRTKKWKAKKFEVVGCGDPARAWPNFKCIGDQKATRLLDPDIPQGRRVCGYYPYGSSGCMEHRKTFRMRLYGTYEGEHGFVQQPIIHRTKPSRFDDYILRKDKRQHRTERGP